MILNSKAKPKSCGCKMCRRGRRTDAGHEQVKHEQRSYRQRAKALLRKFRDEDSEVPTPEHYGSYTD